ncbi:probable WRKY transcription factor protein 1 [Cynara cardunculus var. scolymus]|uniref:probable WRKY transcription factor protein 1 n=1 Tax=Cynara cardunculus var. scolymus TaxID=59895 RepID=UPI000D62A9F0|nr:probable WRKY transcription factor protein 1 [Cynara cardunculus var. scolymus]
MTTTMPMTNTTMTTTIPMTNTTMTTTMPMTNTALPATVGNYNQQNASFSGEALNQHHPMSIKNIKQMLQNSNYPVNIPKIQNPPVPNNNLSMLSLPSHGNIPAASNYHHYPQQQQHQPLPQQNHLHVNQQSIRVSEHTNVRPHVTTRQSKVKTKRVYKMPVQGLNTDKLSWKKYGAKLADGSPYPRVYYKCTVTNDCKVRRKVQLNRSDPNTLIVTYSGDHNHSPPSSLNFFTGSSSGKDLLNNHDARVNDETNHPSSSKAITPPTILSFGKKQTQNNNDANKDDDVFGGLEDFMPL